MSAIPQQLHIKILHQEMKEQRKKGVWISLRQHLESKEGYCRTPKLSFEKYLHQAGIDLNRLRIQQFYDLDQYRDMQLLFPELIHQTIYTGLTKGFNIENLLAFSADTTADTVTMPFADYSERKKFIGREYGVPIGVQFVKDKVLFGQKRLTVKKFGKAIDLPYEYYKNVPYPILAKELQQIGKDTAVDMRCYFVDVLLNGDGAIGMDNKVIEDSIGSIGVYDTADKIVYKDILRGSTRMSLLGLAPEDLIADENETIEIKSLPEYSTPLQGQPRIQLSDEDNITTPDKIWLSYDQIGTDCAVIFNREMCTGMFTMEGVQVEEQKIIDRQIHEATFSTSFALANLRRDARLKIDGTSEFSDFPEWQAIKTTK